MSSELPYDILRLPSLVETTASSSLTSVLALSLEAVAFAALIMTVVGLWVAPGGLAWAMTKLKPGRVRIPGPSGLATRVLARAVPHRKLADISREFGAKPLLAFSVGLTRFVISSQPDTAKEILTSPAFADRPVKESAYELLFHRAMGFAPYGDYWRNLRRISATYLFSPKRIADFEGYRSEVGSKMADQVSMLMAKNGVVEVKTLLHFGSLNSVMMTVFGRSYDFGDESGEASELEVMVSEGYDLLGIFNWTDHFPLLGWMDLQGVRKRSRALVEKVNVFVGKIIDDHRANKGDKVGDFVDVLLDLESAGETTKLTESDMIAVLWEMIFRGTDTVAIVLEWVLAEMVLNPEIQAKAQAEIDSVVGRTRPVSDSDITHMPFLQAIVKETLRVHPPGPLLSWARLAIHDVDIGQSHIPAGTTAMVNMWSITHDPAIWPEPETFNPDRFSENNVSVLGSDLRLAPFGAGRRVCPGKALGLASVHLWLAQLLQKFDWVASRAHPVDLSEQLKLSMEMKQPLVCKAVARV